MPVGTMLVYLPAGAMAITYPHPLQIFTAHLAIAGLALGVLICILDEYNGCHPIIGYVIVSLTVLVQPSLGLLQHLLFRRNGKKAFPNNTHRWLGRAILLGMINGGLAFRFAGLVGSDDAPK